MKAGDLQDLKWGMKSDKSCFLTAQAHVFKKIFMLIISVLVIESDLISKFLCRNLLNATFCGDTDK